LNTYYKGTESEHTIYRTSTELADIQVALLQEMNDMLGNPIACEKHKQVSWRDDGSLEAAMYTQMCDALAASSGAVVAAARVEIEQLRRKCKELEEKNTELTAQKVAAERTASDVQQLRRKCLALSEVAKTAREAMETKDVEIKKLTAECGRLRRELEKMRDMVAMTEVVVHAPLVGIGLALDRDVETNVITIVEIVPKLGADVCGQFQVGDVVTDIDDVSVENLKWDEVKALIIGPAGSHCTVKLNRGKGSLEVHCDRVAPAPDHKFNPSPAQHPALGLVQNTVQKTSLANKNSTDDQKHWSLVRNMTHVIRDRVKRDHNRDRGAKIPLEEVYKDGALLF
jgi:hypothetical protein